MTKESKDRLKKIIAKNDQRAVILACSSLKDYVDEAQRRVGSDFPVVYLSRIYHMDPMEMRQHILAALQEIKGKVDLVMVAMGFCGGSWEDVEAPCALVIPKVDDCVSLLLQTGDKPISNLKKQGHLYVREKDPSRESFHAIFDKLTQNIDEETKRRYHQDWMQLYSHIDIIDTGLNHCRRAEYREIVQKDADWLEAELSYVQGGTYLLEKMLSGNWDEQFLILEQGNKTDKKQMLQGDTD